MTDITQPVAPLGHAPGARLKLPGSRADSLGQMSLARSMRAVALVSWLLATGLLAASPLVYFVSGSSDGATEAGRAGLAAIPALMAYPLLMVPIAIVRRGQGTASRRLLRDAAVRALLLMLVATAVLALAHRLGTTRAIGGDEAWTLFWIAAATAWVLVSAALARPRTSSSP